MVATHRFSSFRFSSSADSSGCTIVEGRDGWANTFPLSSSSESSSESAIALFFFLSGIGF